MFAKENQTDRAFSFWDWLYSAYDRPECLYLLIKGAVPGPKGAVVLVRSAAKEA